MNEPAFLTKEWAHWILAREVKARGGGIDRSLKKLESEVSKLIGVAGFRALAARAAQLSAMPTEAGEGANLLLAHTIDLLNRFIGPTLTERILRRAWADLPEPVPVRGEEE